MKYAILFAAVFAFAQYVIVPSIDYSAVAAQQTAHFAAIEEASK